MDDTAPGTILERAITELRARKPKRNSVDKLRAALNWLVQPFLRRRNPRPGSGPHLALMAYSAWTKAGDYHAGRMDGGGAVPGAGRIGARSAGL